MTGHPFTLSLTREAQRALDELRSTPQHQKRAERVDVALRQLGDDPRHPGLRSHQYAKPGRLHPAAVYESYVQNNAPGAWRIWWRYGPSEHHITVLVVGPHDCLLGADHIPDDPAPEQTSGSSSEPPAHRASARRARHRGGGSKRS